MGSILVCDPVASECIDTLKSAGHQVDSLGDESLIDVISDYDAIVVRSKTKVTRQVIEKSNLKVIARAGAGLDNVDLDAAKEKGVLVVNSPDALTNAVAEMVILLSLSLLRHVCQANDSLKSGKWIKKELKGSELSSKTVGIIGFGAIGRRVADICLAFGSKVLAYDVIDVPSEYKVRGVDQVGLDDLLSESDLVTLHVPLIEQTKHMINSDTISKMKEGVILINAARGGVVDSKSLLDGLNGGHVAGAGLDVFEEEPPGEEFKDLLSHPNVLPTPHIASQTVESQEKAGLIVANKLIDALK